MAEQDDASADLARRIRQQDVTGGAGGGRQAGLGLVADPGQRAERSVHPRRDRGAIGGPGGALGAKAVIDGQHDKRPTRAPGPGVDRKEQSQRVSPAGERDTDRTRAAHAQMFVQDRADPGVKIEARRVSVRG